MTPLTTADRDDLRRRFEARLVRTHPMTADAFAFRPVERPPIAVTGALYYLFGRRTETIPAALFADPAVMLADQERRLYQHLLTVDDDFVPYVMPWFGTVVAASAFGCKVGFMPGQDPAVDPTWYPVQTVDDVKALRVPDPTQDGLMPEVLRYLRHFREHSVLPIGITDCQGPLTTANQLMGYDTLIYLMDDDPVAAHHLMDTVTTALIRWVRAQKAVIGDADDFCISDQQAYVGGQAGIWLSDDDAPLVSPDFYREFVVPYNSRLLSEFGGGMVHYCGNATHHADNFLATDGLKGLHIFALHDLDALARLQQKVAGRIVLAAGDFTPVDVGRYADEYARLIDPRGVSMVLQYSPIVGLLPDGRYQVVDRPEDGARDVHARFVEAWARRAEQARAVVPPGGATDA